MYTMVKAYLARCLDGNFFHIDKIRIEDEHAVHCIDPLTCDDRPEIFIMGERTFSGNFLRYSTYDNWEVLAAQCIH